MTFYELYKKIDSEICPASLSCEWDNDGIMCMPDPNREVKRVLISLDVTEKIVDYAISNDFDTIISHHPLVFKAQNSISVYNYTQRKLIKLIKNNVNVMSFHTRLDAADGGVNDMLCKFLQLDSDICKDEADPIGRITSVWKLDNEKEISLDAFAEKVKQLLSTPVVIYNGSKPVKKIYVCGGDGKDMIKNALLCGADTLLTGRASYNTIVDAKDMGLNIVEAGHFFTEHPICYALRDIVLGYCKDAYVFVSEESPIKIIK